MTENTIEVEEDQQSKTIEAPRSTYRPQDSTFSDGKMPRWQVPPTKFNSTFTMQQADLPRLTMNTKTDRFRRDPTGGKFAETYANLSSFRSNEYHKPKVVNPKDIPHGRPLWLDQINKQVPAAAEYDLDR